ncbi:hypothetical protein COW46_03300 [Candidatus Gracilibacteria bacterium CG17_big_fil_post_rev_8_21_14_2_50_48_13]|nr:MAG: hypothetical protein COW46_03300 [Candidatus Gracilibacteria bacterium CG17_big_fil_post_rev_8_21_14_2_50_48_13]
MIKKTLHSLFIARRKEIPFLIFLSFLITFLGARILVGLIYSGALQPMFLYVSIGKGDVIHVHHLVYGIVILSIIGFIGVVFPEYIKKHPHVSAILYGVGLGLIFDEAALWMRLEDDYDHRLSYDSVILVGSVLGLCAYFAPFWRWFTRIRHKIAMSQRLPLRFRKP